jgi:hypothetical protein
MMTSMSKQPKPSTVPQEPTHETPESLFRASPFQFTQAGEAGFAMMDATQVLTFGESELVMLTPGQSMHEQ